MKVSVVYYNFLREAVGKKDELIELPEGETIFELLTLLTNRYGEKLATKLFHQGKVVSHLRIFLNDTIVTDYQHQLVNNDEVCLFFAISGG
jgi:molybdopterin converting factor small subunit